MRVALYARTSSDEQRQAETIRSQVERLKAHAQERGYKVIGTYVDDGVSGDDPIQHRLEGAKLIRGAQDGKVERVIIYALDRLGRRQLNILSQVERLRRRGVSVEAVKEGLVFDDSFTGKMLLSMLSTTAELERDTIRERTQRGRESRRNAGRIVNPNAHLFGYGLVRRDRNNGQETEYRINKEEAGIVRDIFKVFTTKHRTIRSLAEYLTKDTRYRPPRGAGRWNKSTVRRILTQEAYVGRFWQGRYETVYDKPTDPDDLEAKQHRRVRLKNRADWGSHVSVPRIIDDATWTQAQRLLATNAERSPRNRKHSYLLAGKVICGVCEDGATKMHGVAVRGVPYYRCSRRDRAMLKPGEHKCKSRDARAEIIEKQAYELLIRHLEDPQGMIDKQEDVSARKAEIAEELTKLAKELMKIDKRIDRNAAMIEDATESELPNLEQRRRLARDDKQRLEQKSAWLKEQLASLSLIAAQAKALKRHAPKGDRDSPTLRERYLRDYIEWVVVRDGNLVDAYGSVLIDTKHRPKWERVANGDMATRGVQAKLDKSSLKYKQMLMEHDDLKLDKRVAVSDTTCS